MARQRMLHPGFFTDADLAECTPLARILFEGLWVEADREGRLEDEPRELKVKLLPYDTCSVASLIDELERIGAVVRYEVDGRRLLWLPKFLKYQHPHQRESPSELPPPPEKPRKGSAEPLPSQEKAMPSRAVSESVTESVSDSKSVTVSGPVGPGVRASAVFVVTPPDTPPESWTADDFWRWAQAKRQKAGFVAEKHPGAELATWFNETMLAVSGDIARLQEAFLRFGDSPYWQKPKEPPPLPFRGFMKQTDRFVPRGPRAS